MYICLLKGMLKECDRNVQADQIKGESVSGVGFGRSHNRTLGSGVLEVYKISTESDRPGYLN